MGFNQRSSDSDEFERNAKLTCDVAVVRKAMKQIDDGKGMTADEGLSSLCAELLAMKKVGARDHKR